jgi:ribosome-associated translation inhibitor RaiA
MNLAVTVRFEGMTPSQALHQDVQRHADKLLQVAPRLLSCNVAIGHSEHSHQQGNRYRVHVHAQMPGAVFEAGRTPAKNRSHEDAYVAVRDAFDALRRQLEDHARIRRGEVKQHTERDATPQG